MGGFARHVLSETLTCEEDTGDCGVGIVAEGGQVQQLLHNPAARDVKGGEVQGCRGLFRSYYCRQQYPKNTKMPQRQCISCESHGNWGEYVR